MLTIDIAHIGTVLHIISHVCDRSCHRNYHLHILGFPHTLVGSEIHNRFENDISSCLNITYSLACRTGSFEQSTVFIFNPRLIKAPGWIFAFSCRFSACNVPTSHSFLIEAMLDFRKISDFRNTTRSLFWVRWAWEECLSYWKTPLCSWMVYVSFLYGRIHIWAIIPTALDFRLTINKPAERGSDSFKFFFGRDKRLTNAMIMWWH